MEQKREYRVVFENALGHIEHTEHYQQYLALLKIAELEKQGLTIVGRVVRDIGKWERF